MLLTWSTSPVAASLLWNSLPSDIQSSSLPVFRQRSITFIFRQSFPDIYSTVTLLRLCGLRNSSCYFSHTKKFDWHWHSLMWNVKNPSVVQSIVVAISPVHTSNNVEATLLNATMSNVASTLLPFLATMSKQRSTLLPKTATMSNEFCVESFRPFDKVECCFDIVASVDRALVLSRLDYGSTVLYWCSVYHSSWPTRFSRYKTSRHDWCLSPVVTTTSTHCCTVFTGCGSLNELRSGYRFLYGAYSSAEWFWIDSNGKIGN